MASIQGIGPEGCGLYLSEFAPKGPNKSAQGRAKRRQPLSAALGLRTDKWKALKGRKKKILFRPFRALMFMSSLCTGLHPVLMDIAPSGHKINIAYFDYTN